MGNFGKKSAVELDDLWENMSDFITSHVKISDFGTSETRFHNFKCHILESGTFRNQISDFQMYGFMISNVRFQIFQCQNFRFWNFKEPDLIISHVRILYMKWKTIQNFTKAITTI